MSAPPPVHLVAAARPNLPKLAALWHALAARPGLCQPVLVHTGQHADPAMFGAHLADLGLPAPQVSLGIAAGGGHAEFTARTLAACGALWQRERPALVVVAGDVDATLAAALAARKLGIPVAHLEAGLRCGDRDMAEEINRRAVDAIADLLWAPDTASAARLLAEGHAPEAVRAVGNAMIDTLLARLPAARARPLPEGLLPGAYGVVTLHRAANVDDRAALTRLLGALREAAELLPLAWPLHPRSAARLREAGLAVPPGVRLLPPLGYLDFIGLLARARLVATDSGGVQEEAALLDLPCMTLRPSTERPVTLESGANRLLRPHELAEGVQEVLDGAWPPARPIPLWDGRAGARMAEHLAAFLAARPAAPGSTASALPPVPPRKGEPGGAPHWRVARHPGRLRFPRREARPGWPLPPGAQRGMSDTPPPAARRRRRRWSACSRPRIRRPICASSARKARRWPRPAGACCISAPAPRRRSGMRGWPSAPIAAHRAGAPGCSACPPWRGGRGRAAPRCCTPPSPMPGWRRCGRRGAAAPGWCWMCTSTTPRGWTTGCRRRCGRWRAPRCAWPAAPWPGAPMRWWWRRTGWTPISPPPAAPSRCATTPPPAPWRRAAMSRPGR
ncbi:UDP-N-acetylglucosamine 2-epimerase (non-hydrolyzing) [Pseudoroseomonas cervicalis]|nr:UDP-N-acetylglucosamine 2-epimerase (non-hydrolyzing) [Pseudoroseomonas cervicalis]WBV43175.1 UDP-N-acetylglucosamine 2-epimerase (non-hydrolyzing) [Pseudoroseomonas cervicalis]